MIYDLKTVNPTAKVSVRLMAQVGIGTIAAGVAKALPARSTSAGTLSGTGASPLSSIETRAFPQEIGLAETQVLLANGLRE